MKDIQQLIKKNSLEGRYEEIFPKTFLDAITDKESGVTLSEILAMFNMLFLSYGGNRGQTRLQVPMSLRREGVWVTYVLFDKTVVTEWYSSEAIDDVSFADSANWRDGSNSLVGSITISSDGFWVIDGVATSIKAQGEPGITPMLRIGSNNHLQVSYTEGSSYIDVSSEPIITRFRVNNNKLQQSMDLGNTWTDVTEELAYQFRNSGNKLQVSKDLGTTWTDVSDYIAAWFKFTGTAGSSQADNVGKIQISRDNGSSWTDLSGEFTNSLHIKGYVSAVANLPSSAVQGDIYGVGPTYDSGDTSHNNPIYRLYVKDSSGWVDNGVYTSIAAGVVQELGNSETEVISQNAITKELRALDHSYITTLEAPIIFSTANSVTKAKIWSNFLILDTKGVTPYISIPAQEIEVPRDYGCIVAVLDKSSNTISSTLKAVQINRSVLMETGKSYIPIFAWTYLDKNNVSSFLEMFNTPFKNTIINYNPSWDTYTNTLSINNVLYGTYIPIVCKIEGFYCKINNNDSDLTVYKFNIKTNTSSILKTFSKDTLNVGINYLAFDKPEVIGEDEQFMINGKIAYYMSSTIDYTERSLNYYLSSDSKVPVNYTNLKLAICYKIFNPIKPMEILERIPRQGEETIQSINTVNNISTYYSTLNNVGYVGRYIPTVAKVSQIILNVRVANEPIDIALLDMEGKTLTPIKTITPSDTGVITTTFDSPVEVNYTKQIVVHGKIGYTWATTIEKGKSGNQISYNYSGSGTITFNPINLTDFAVGYTLESPISKSEYITRNLDYINQKIYNIKEEETSDYEVITVNVANYNNNLRTVFSSIIPSKSVHYTVLIPEGTYNVDSWFTDEEKAVEANSFRGLELPNYVKLLGVGAREKIILQWINTSVTHRGFISTLNTHEWHELENLTVIGENIRYAVHDDLWNGLARYLRVTNCDFKVTDCSRAWGAGHNGGYDGEFIDCKFSVYRKLGNMDTMTYIEPFGLHDNQYNAGDSKVLLSNCRFYNVYTDHPCVNFGMSSNDGITYARIIGCKMNTNVFLGGNSDGLINCRVTGFGNIMGIPPAISDNAIESIDTLIDLIP